MKPVKDIIREYLELSGYDGLYHPDNGMNERCGCWLHDFMPCNGEMWDISECRPGVYGKADADDPDYDEGTDLIVPKEGND